MSLIESMTVVDIIDAMSNQFTNVDWKISQFIASHPDDFCSMTAAEIARQAGVSDASVIRFAQKIGFDGFQELRSKFKRELSATRQSNPSIEAATLQAPLVESIAKLFDGIESSSVDEFARLADACDSILITGIGRAANLASILTNKLMLLGMRAVAITDPDIMSVQAETSKSGTLFIFLDLTENTDRMERCATIACAHNSKLITLSHHHESSLRDLSNCYFFLPPSSGPNQSYSISSETMVLVIWDLLFGALLRSRHDDYYDLVKKTSGFVSSLGMSSSKNSSPSVLAF